MKNQKFTAVKIT